jgi:flavodoxin
MKALVIYDSYFGNTKKIAEAIAGELEPETAVVAVTDFKPADLNGVELLIVGSPILGFRPSVKIEAFLNGLGKDQLSGVKAAAFDTRVRIFFHGDAAAKIAAGLEKAGARIIAKATGFVVEGKQGPLAEGELEKAANWAQTLT